MSWGTCLDIEPFISNPAPESIKQQEDGRVDWNLASGVYRAKEIVRELNKLLMAVLVQLGEKAGL
ncbi:hypothetical protein [Paenibacillus algorifonticola]|nr:hypothetical protein [Paenibacillus algorifonticola]